MYFIYSLQWYHFLFISRLFKTFPECYWVVPSRPKFFPNFSKFSRATVPDICSLVTVSAIREVTSATVQSRPDQNKTGNADFCCCMLKKTANVYILLWIFTIFKKLKRKGRIITTQIFLTKKQFYAKLIWRVSSLV